MPLIPCANKKAQSSVDQYFSPSPTFCQVSLLCAHLLQHHNCDGTDTKELLAKFLLKDNAVCLLKKRHISTICFNTIFLKLKCYLVIETVPAGKCDFSVHAFRSFC